jgi:hypothetical protein
MSPAERSPAERSPTERSPAERSPAERSPAERSPAERSPAERSPAERLYNCPICPLKGVRRRELCNKCCRKAKKEVSLGEYVVVKELMKKTTDKESTNVVLRDFSNIYEYIVLILLYNMSTVHQLSRILKI